MLRTNPGLFLVLAPPLVLENAFAQAPHPINGGYSLPNGWRITPVGKAIDTEDLILNLSGSPDGKVVIEQHGGFNPHGLTVIDTATEMPVQRIGLKSAWLGLAWSHDGSKFYVSGGNASYPPNATVAPAPAGSTPNGLALDAKNNMLFMANADNNCIEVVNVREEGESQVMGFIPSGWYPARSTLRRR